jgi:hypothetical protein
MNPRLTSKFFSKCNIFKQASLLQQKLNCIELFFVLQINESIREQLYK